MPLSDRLKMRPRPRIEGSLAAIRCREVGPLIPARSCSTMRSRRREIRPSFRPLGAATGHLFLDSFPGR